MADRDPNDASGRDENSEVDDGNGDDFSSAFEAFAAGRVPDGGAPAPKDGDEEEDDADAGHGGAEREPEGSPSEGDDKAPPAKAPADKAAAGEEAPDPWAKATPEQIAERDRLRAELETARKSDEGSRRRASGLQRQINALRSTTAAQPPQEGKDGEEGNKGDAWKALDDKIKQLREDYPEIADTILPLLEAQRDGLADLKGKVTPVIEADQEEVLTEQVKALEGVHKDWRFYGIDESPEYAAWLKGQKPEVQAENANFRNWLDDQPAAIQALSNSWDAREVGVAITLYKTERAEAIRKAGGGNEPGKADETDERRRRQLDGGAQVRSRPGAAASGAPDDFSGAFEHFSRKRAAAGKK